MACILTDPPDACFWSDGKTPRFIVLTIVDDQGVLDGEYTFEHESGCTWRVQPGQGLGSGSIARNGGGIVPDVSYYDWAIFDDADTLIDELFGGGFQGAIKCGAELGPDVGEENGRLTVTIKVESLEMSYCTRADIENLFGAKNITIWSNLDNTTAQANEARIEAAIDYASNWIDDRFRDGRYSLPLRTPEGLVPATVRDWCARLAGVWLYESRGTDEQDENGRPFNRLTMHRRMVERHVLRVQMERENINGMRTSGRAGSSNVPYVSEDKKK